MISPLVSVVIPAYKAASYLGECLNSVLRQSYQNFEIIIIDDGSPDQQREVVAPYLKEFKNICYYYQENKGVSAARNKGLELAKGELIAFLDADDVWLQDNLKLKIQKFKEGDFGLVHSDACLIDENSNLINGQLSGEEGSLLNAILSWKSTQVPGPSSILIKREVIENTGFWDENLSTSADQDFFIRVASNYKIGRVAEISWKYRIHSQNMHKNITMMEKDVLYTFEKARANGLFYSKPFGRRCFANMYSILGASWAIDGNNMYRGALFFYKSIITDPFIAFKIVKKLNFKILSYLRP